MPRFVVRSIAGYPNVQRERLFAERWSWDEWDKEREA